jgi:hypothetical protein
MRDTQNAVFGALQRGEHFLDENGVALSGVDFTAARKRLDEVLTSFSTHALDQDVGDRGAKGETAKQRQLRLKLRVEQMEPIAIIARRNLRSVPEFKSLQMPKQSVRGQAFNVSARGMADAATIHKDTLVAHGLPSTFLDDLKAGVDKLETSMSEREKSRTQRVGATKGLTVEEKNGQTVLSVLDALVQQALGGDNEALLRKRQSARLIRRSTGNSSAPAATTQVAPATAASTPAATAASAPAAPSPLPVSGSTPAAAA